ncbi:GntR family transcriptional regulator [Corynebacterium mustelae]|nr:GntR family transcriptional regulator [Corynebacterium mustelae]
MNHFPHKIRSAADQLYRHISKEILEGVYRPDQQLSEMAASEKYGVSRNTLREAFRLLIQEGLLIHRPNRGVFVRAFTVADLEDLYTFRRMCEAACLRHIGSDPDATASCIAAMRQSCLDADQAMANQDWNALAIANNHFHMAIFSSGGNSRMTRLGRTILAQSRLVFMTSGQEDKVHVPFIRDNKRMLEQIERGSLSAAVISLEQYLNRSQANMAKLLAEKQ